MVEATLTTQVPMLPASVVALLGVGIEDANYFEKVHDIVHRDPALVTIALHLANSAAYGGHANTGSLNQAIMRLGARRFVSMMFSTHLVQVFAPASEELARLWRHAISTSVAARMLARVWPQLKLDPDWAAVAGLVHNLGAMTLGVRHVEQYRELISARSFDDDEITTLERNRFGSDHQQLGRSVAEQMALPPQLVEVIEHHHDQTVTPGSLAWLVRTATALAAWSFARGRKGSAETIAQKRFEESISAVQASRPELAVLSALLTEVDLNTKLEFDRLGIPVTIVSGEAG